MKLCDMQCKACRADAPPVSVDELERFKDKIPAWSSVEVEAVRRLRREFAFRDFSDALAFTDRVGALAERNGHHPAIIAEWGKVTVDWWTHKICGLHRTDLILAAKTDTLLTGK